MLAVGRQPAGEVPAVRFVRAVLRVFIAMTRRRRTLASHGRFWEQNGSSGLPLETASVVSPGPQP